MLQMQCNAMAVQWAAANNAAGWRRRRLQRRCSSDGVLAAAAINASALCGAAVALAATALRRRAHIGAAAAAAINAANVLCAAIMRDIMACCDLRMSIVMYDYDDGYEFVWCDVVMYVDDVMCSGCQVLRVSYVRYDRDGWVDTVWVTDGAMTTMVYGVATGDDGICNRLCSQGAGGLRYVRWLCMYATTTMYGCGCRSRRHDVWVGARMRGCRCRVIGYRCMLWVRYVCLRMVSVMTGMTMTMRR